MLVIRRRFVSAPYSTALRGKTRDKIDAGSSVRSDGCRPPPTAIVSVHRTPGRSGFSPAFVAIDRHHADPIGMQAVLEGVGADFRAFATCGIGRAAWVLFNIFLCFCRTDPDDHRRFRTGIVRLIHARTE